MINLKPGPTILNFYYYWGPFSSVCGTFLLGCKKGPGPFTLENELEPLSPPYLSSCTEQDL